MKKGYANIPIIILILCLFSTLIVFIALKGKPYNVPQKSEVISVKKDTNIQKVEYLNYLDQSIYNKNAILTNYQDIKDLVLLGLPPEYPNIKGKEETNNYVIFKHNGENLNSGFEFARILVISAWDNPDKLPLQSYFGKEKMDIIKSVTVDGQTGLEWYPATLDNSDYKFIRYTVPKEHLIWDLTIIYSDPNVSSLAQNDMDNLVSTIVLRSDPSTLRVDQNITYELPASWRKEYSKNGTILKILSPEWIEKPGGYGNLVGAEGWISGKENNEILEDLRKFAEGYKSKNIKTINIDGLEGLSYFFVWEGSSYVFKVIKERVTWTFMFTGGDLDKHINEIEKFVASVKFK